MLEENIAFVGWGVLLSNLASPSGISHDVSMVRSPHDVGAIF